MVQFALETADLIDGRALADIAEEGEDGGGIEDQDDGEDGQGGEGPDSHPREQVGEAGGGRGVDEELDPQVTRTMR